MKKRIPLLTTLAAMLAAAIALSGVASATHTSSNGPPRDFANGSGYAPDTDQTVAFSATSDPSGENAQGHYRIETSPGPVFQGPVTCLATDGNRAVIGGPDPDFPQVGRFIFVEDNGTPSEVAPDRFNTGTSFEATQSLCQEFLGRFGNFQLFPIDRGNFTVHDAPPANVTP